MWDWMFPEVGVAPVQVCSGLGQAVGIAALRYPMITKVE